MDLVGMLQGEGLHPFLRMADGGVWRLDISLRFQHLLGQRVHIVGRRSEFDIIDVERIEPA